MERVGSEGTSGEMSARGGHPDCESGLGQLTLSGLSAAPPAGVDPAERLSRLLATIDSSIIPRLAHAHGLPAAATLARPRAVVVVAAEVDRFARVLIAADGAAARRVVEACLASGLQRESLYVDLLAPAARRLGEMWLEDECTFGDVTVGVGRLQRTLRELAASGESGLLPALEGHRVLLLASPGEQHTLGLSMVSECFRAARWDVTCSTDTHSPEPVAVVKSEWFDAIGFSAGTHTRLNWLALAIADVRRASRNQAIVVLVGGPVFAIHPEYVTTVGADASAPDGQRAPIVAGDLLGLRLQRA
jgi:methanogenic corrinoid protein MtbC1